jgi:hypothetical protein
MKSLRQGIRVGTVLVLALLAGHGPATAEEKKEEVPSVICGGCVSATHTTQGKGSITPYGRIELDGIYTFGIPTRSIPASSTGMPRRPARRAN